MKKLMLAFVALALVAVVAAPAFAQKTTGNGSESGPHYNLNIIGTEKAKTATMTDSSRHTIFVALNFSDPTPTSPTLLTTLDRKNKIFLQEGPFQVLDGNAWDGAIFQLPAPDCDPLTVDATNMECAYRVYIRALGSPKLIDGKSPYANMTTCGIDVGLDGIAGTADDVFQCSTETVTVTRYKGKSSFENVTKELLTLCLDTNADKVCDTRTQLFSDDFYSYFWDYDNFGLRLAQLRFYPKNPLLP